MVEKDIPEHIYRIEGKRPGPTTTILGGTHGDELIGIEVIKQLLAFFNINEQAHGTTHKNDFLTGELYIGFGNPKAIEKGTRAAENGPDLNRSFHIEEIEAEASDSDRYDLRRARRLMPLLKKTDYLFDLHCTSAESIPFVCFGNDTVKHNKIYSKIPVDHVLTDPLRILPKDVGKEELGTTDSVVNMHGGVGLCYETGQKNDISEANTVFDVMLSLLNEIEMLTTNDFKKTENITGVAQQRVYHLVAMIKAKEKEFVFEKHLSQGFSPVKKEEKIGFYPKTGECEYALCDGLILFQKSVQDTDSSNSLFYIAKEL